MGDDTDVGAGKRELQVRLVDCNRAGMRHYIVFVKAGVWRMTFILRYLPSTTRPSDNAKHLGQSDKPFYRIGFTGCAYFSIPRSISLLASIYGLSRTGVPFQLPSSCCGTIIIMSWSSHLRLTSVPMPIISAFLPRLGSSSYNLNDKTFISARTPRSRETMQPSIRLSSGLAILKPQSCHLLAAPKGHTTSSL